MYCTPAWRGLLALVLILFIPGTAYLQLFRSLDCCIQQTSHRRSIIYSIFISIDRTEFLQPAAQNWMTSVHGAGLCVDDLPLHTDFSLIGILLTTFGRHSLNFPMS